jgi:hypothetical protein
MSNLKHVMANYGFAFGNPAKDYAIKIATEQITGIPIESKTFPDMEKGHIQEPIARELYERTFFVNVEIDNFYCNDKVGYSPDGGLSFIEKTGRHTGVIEIKARNYAAHYQNVKRQNLEPESKWQCIGALKYGEFEWLDFISYCPEFPEDCQLFVHRAFPEQYEKEFDMIDERVEEFFQLVAETKATILNAKYF